MHTLTGKYNSAKIFTDQIEPSCTDQIMGLPDLEMFADAKIRIMPDCHAGAGCVIGFTADLEACGWDAVSVFQRYIIISITTAI